LQWFRGLLPQSSSFTSSPSSFLLPPSSQTNHSPSSPLHSPPPSSLIFPVPPFP
jgi:hypothetical protein